MKKFIVIIFLLLAVVIGSVLLYNRFKKTSPVQQNQTTANLNRAAYIQKQTQFNNTMKAALNNDSDGDGLSNADEAKYGTDPNKADTDGDGLLDKAEITIYHTDPLKADTNGDGFSDGYEVRHHTNPLDPKSHP